MPKLPFQDLENLRRFLQEIRSSQVESLRFYFHEASGGVHHKLDVPKFSRASTATCVLSLIATGLWEQSADSEPTPWFGSGDKLLREMMLKPFDSAGLGVDNPFTTGFALETYCALEKFYTFPPKEKARLEGRATHAEVKLIEALTSGGTGNPSDTEYPHFRGAAALKGYPPSAYLTQLVVRVLLRRRKLRRLLGRDVRKWAFDELNRQIGLRWAKDKTADIFALIYSAILLASFPAKPYATPDEERVLRLAVTMLFEDQRPDGTWSPSRPLFHYPGIGNAYCFDYEMLVQLLQTDRLKRLLLNHLDGLNRAALGLNATEFGLLSGASRGWASGHHPQLKGPESWSTASVFHFAYALDRLLAEVVRQEVFQNVDQTYRKPLAPKLKPSEFASDLLDSRIRFEGRYLSLRRTLWTKFVQPLIGEVRFVEEGRPLSDKVHMSAIFFGPPGTSKTELAKRVALSIGWPLLIIDPSHLVRTGMDRIQAEANELFGMLAVTERIVVLFDEFDEMVRDRSSPTSEANSRFLTTAMLPKLTSIHDNRRIVFILATNYIDQFDFAVTRLGRFDKRFQIMPPTLAAKMEKWPKLAEALAGFSTDQRDALREQLELLTFSECKDLVDKIDPGTMNPDAIARIVERAATSCTLNQKPAEPREISATSWLQQMREQSHYVRI
jgi:hypothetical protein